MTITFVGQTAVGSGGGTATYNITKSLLGSLQNGDVVVVHAFGLTGAPTWSSSTGFTNHSSGASGSALLYRVIDGTEGATFSFTRSATLGAGLVDVVALRGADTSSPIDATSFVTGNGGSLVIPAVTTTVNNAYILQHVSKSVTGAATWSPPGGTTELYDVDTATVAYRVAGGSDVQATAGTTGTRTWTQTAFGATKGSIVAIRPSTVTSKSSSDTASISISDTGSVFAQDAPLTTNDSTSISISEQSGIDNLATFHQAFENRNTSRVNIGMLGASIVEGAKAPLSKSIEVKLADKLRTAFSTTGSGWGYIGIPSTQVYATGLTQITWTGGTYNEAYGFGEHHGVWLTTAAQNGVLTFTNPSPASSIKLSTFVWAFGSATGGQYRVNGGSWVVFNTYAATTQMNDISISGPFNTGDIIEVKHGGGDGSSLFISGFVHYNGDETAGLHVHNFGHFGYTTNEWMYASSGYPQWTNEIVAHDLDLLIVSDIGANDAAENGGKTSAQVKIDYLAMLNRIRTDGYSGPLVLVAVYDFSYGYPTLEPWANYVQVIKEVAKQFGAGYLDLNALMPPTPNAIYHADNIHTNANGDANELIAGYLMDTIAPEVELPEFVSSADSSSLTISENSQIVKSSTATDTSSLSMTETASIAKTSTQADTASLSITESRGLTSSTSRTDSATISIAETTSSLRGITSTDTLSISVTESGSLSSDTSIPGSDSGSVSLVEQGSVYSTGVGTDSSTITLTDSSTTMVSISRTDSLVVGVTESVAIANPTMATDNQTITITESSNLVIITYKNASDGTSIAVTETMSVSSEFTRADGLAMTAEETHQFVQNRIVESTDGLALQIVEISNAYTPKESSDNSTVAVSELSSVAISIVASDTLELDVEETSDYNDLSPNKPFAWINHEWVRGDMKIYVNGKWRFAIKRVYRNGSWS